MIFSCSAFGLDWYATWDDYRPTHAVVYEFYGPKGWCPVVYWFESSDEANHKVSVVRHREDVRDLSIVPVHPVN